MARPKGSTIGSNPLDAVVPMRQAEQLAKEEKHAIQARREKVTIVLPADLMERLRAASYWTRRSLAGLAEDGIRDAVEKAERENGGPFQTLDEKLRPGRKVGGVG